MIDPVPLNLLAQTALVRHVPLAIFIFAFGGILGSFINVAIYRLPEGRSVISPPSRCVARCTRAKPKPRWRPPSDLVLTP